MNPDRKERHVRPLVTVRNLNGYRNADYVAQVRELTRQYPGIRIRSIGQSVLGEPLVALVLGEGPEAVHMNAAVHANEWITAPLLLRFVERLAEAWEAGEECGLDAVTLWAVPMVNPDGADLAQDGIPPGFARAEELAAWNGGSRDFRRWKANIRGVDLNDQFPAGWELERERRGVCGPAPQDYGGPHPLSEPEAAALARLTREMRFSRVLSLHTQGKEIYWNYREREPREAEMLAARLAASGGGYRAVKLAGSDAGYKDWFIDEFGRPGFTVEAGEGVNPLPLEEFEEIYEELAPILAEFIRG
ncbi:MULTISPECIES: M14 family metallocarboxypeptidase [Paenibacillus]|uniref:M14 family metallopeptidase n=1 Tax=Paenibacillus TaxID=44249 RepID=UPI002FE39C1A